MMQFLSIVLVIAGSTNAIPLLEVEQEWSKFLEEFNPVYKDSTELQYRKQIFQENLENIQKHNAEYDLGLHTFRAGVNQFADKTDLEISQSLLGLNTQAIRDNINRSQNQLRANFQKELPESIDWRQKGAVTPVKTQGNCKSSYAFASVGALEGQYFLATNKTVSFSAQQLLDCSESNAGCAGGDMLGAYLDMGIGGVATEESYPYKGENGTCAFRKDMAVAEVNGLLLYISGPEQELKAQVALTGPMAAFIQVTKKFTQYDRGVFFDEECSNDEDDLNHQVLVVGYGSENGTDYWLVKNSWSDKWGDNGYIKMSRNKNNNCMIASCYGYPTIIKPNEH